MHPLQLGQFPSPQGSNPSPELQSRCSSQAQPALNSKHRPPTTHQHQAVLCSLLFTRTMCECIAQASKAGFVAIGGTSTTAMQCRTVAHQLVVEELDCRRLWLLACCWMAIPLLVTQTSKPIKISQQPASGNEWPANSSSHEVGLVVPRPKCKAFHCELGCPASAALHGI